MPIDWIIICSIYPTKPKPFMGISMSSLLFNLMNENTMLPYFKKFIARVKNRWEGYLQSPGITNVQTRELIFLDCFYKKKESFFSH